MQCSVLTDGQIDRIHEASLAILGRVGVVIPHEDMLSRLADRGAWVDTAEQRVKMPADLVEWAIDTAGKTFTLYGRDLEKTARFGVGARNYNSAAGQASWLESPGGERRYASLADVATATRLGDVLDAITMPGSMSDPHELPVAWRCVAVAAEMIRNTTKPITFWLHDRASAVFLIELMVAVRGSEADAAKYPLFYPFLEPISPLRFPFDGIDLLYETSRLNLPVPIGPMAQMGMTAPATMAGTMAQQNAEVLAALVVTQCIREGLPVCYGGLCHSFDMRTTQLVFAGPEQALFGAAMTQIGKRYGLPVYVNSGLTDSKAPDAQAGIEIGITLQLAAAAGADIFGHMGICGVDQAASLDLLVMQSEVISYVESVMRQMAFDDETFGLDVIETVGPGGNFIGERHTRDHFKREMWFPSLLDRDYYDPWYEGGASTLADRCRQEKERLLATHQAEPVAADLDRELTGIVEAARRHLTA
jgi:trimethylamine:corrinoid methyltransferase-like protein